ncbi:MAG: ferritin-like domain-containing protein [bacterium]
MKIDSLKKLYLEELRDLYDVEEQILSALPKMAKASSHGDVQNAFHEHLEVTKRQKERLEKVFDLLGEKPKAKKCEGIRGIIRDGEEIIKQKPEPEVLDAALIASAQKVEHYEMAAYGTLRSYARHLGYEDQADLLQETLNEEGETDHRLTRLATRDVNLEAI